MQQSAVIYLLLTSSIIAVQSKAGHRGVKQRVLLKDDSLDETSSESDDVLDSREREALRKYFKRTQQTKTKSHREGNRRSLYMSNARTGGQESKMSRGFGMGASASIGAGAGTGSSAGGTGNPTGGAGISATGGASLGAGVSANVAGTSAGGAGISAGGTGISTGGTGISAGGTGISAGGTGISAGGTGISAGGTGISTGGTGISAGGTGISAGGTGISAGGTGISTGGTGISAGGTGISAGGTGISAGGTGISAGGTGISAGGTGISTGGTGISSGGAGISAVGTGISVSGGANLGTAIPTGGPGISVSGSAHLENGVSAGGTGGLGQSPFTSIGGNHGMSLAAQIGGGSGDISKDSSISIELATQAHSTLTRWRFVKSDPKCKGVPVCTVPPEGSTSPFMCNGNGHTRTGISAGAGSNRSPGLSRLQRGRKHSHSKKHRRYKSVF